MMASLTRVAAHVVKFGQCCLFFLVIKKVSTSQQNVSESSGTLWTHNMYCMVELAEYWIILGGSATVYIVGG